MRHPTHGRGSNQYVTRGTSAGKTRRADVGAVAMATCPGTPGEFTDEEIAEQAAYTFGGGDVRDLRQRVQDPDCPRWLLDLAAGHGEASIRKLVASHRNCPPSAIVGLAQDPHYQVAARATCNEVCPPDARHLQAFTVVDPDGTAVATSDDLNALAGITAAGERRKVYPTDRKTLQEATGGPGSWSDTGMFAVVINSDPPTMMTLDSDLETQQPLPNGAYVIEDIDAAEAFSVEAPDGTYGWVNVEAVGEHCEDCNGKGSYNIGSAADPEIDNCGNCEGLGRLIPDTERAAVPVPPADSDLWWTSP